MRRESVRLGGIGILRMVKYQIINIINVQILIRWYYHLFTGRIPEVAFQCSTFLHSSQMWIKGKILRWVFSRLLNNLLGIIRKIYRNSKVFLFKCLWGFLLLRKKVIINKIMIGKFNDGYDNVNHDLIIR